MEFVQTFTLPDFKVKILHRQFHLISTVLVGKTQKMSENKEIHPVLPQSFPRSRS